MTEISVIQCEDGALVVDSRLIAERLGVNHSDWYRNIVIKYQTETEQAFGHLRFENDTVTNSVGAVNTVKFALLTEDQATFLMTLSRNTPEVIACKQDLVIKFSRAKQLLKEQGIHLLPHTSVYIRRLENMRDHQVDDDLWMIFREANEVLLMIEKEYRVPVEQMDLCDGSIGKHWSAYRKTQDWSVSPRSYIHNFRDRRGERESLAYDYSEIKYFRRWLREVYIPIHLPSYLIEKYGKRAVRKIYEEINKVDDFIISLTEEKRSTAKQDEMYKVFLAARATLENRQFLTDS
jgi:phage regulator Rha-like protein